MTRYLVKAHLDTSPAAGVVTTKDKKAIVVSKDADTSPPLLPLPHTYTNTNPAVGTVEVLPDGVLKLTPLLYDKDGFRADMDQHATVSPNTLYMYKVDCYSPYRERFLKRGGIALAFSVEFLQNPFLA